MNIQILLFDQYETLDAMGPLEVFGRLPDEYKINCVSLGGGTITSTQGAMTQTEMINPLDEGILLVPGGRGARALVEDECFLEILKMASEYVKWCLSVCTGSALFAKAGLLDGRQATSNKKAWAWVVEQSEAVNWCRQARWCVDGPFYTSSGVSAGMDMALGFIADQHGETVAKNIAQDIEYIWHDDKEVDPFCLIYQG